MKFFENYKRKAEKDLSSSFAEVQKSLKGLDVETEKNDRIKVWGEKVFPLILKRDSAVRKLNLYSIQIESAKNNVRRDAELVAMERKFTDMKGEIYEDKSNSELERKVEIYEADYNEKVTELGEKLANFDSIIEEIAELENQLGYRMSDQHPVEGLDIAHLREILRSKTNQA